MKKIRYSTKAKKDLKKYRNDLQLMKALYDVLEKLANGTILPKEYKAHRSAGRSERERNHRKTYPGSTYTPTSASWTMDVMDKENWKSLKHSTTNSISVTTTETDRNGTQYDVDVLAECHFN